MFKPKFAKAPYSNVKKTLRQQVLTQFFKQSFHITSLGLKESSGIGIVLIWIISPKKIFSPFFSIHFSKKNGKSFFQKNRKKMKTKNFSKNLLEELYP